MGVENIVADPLYPREVPLARLVDPGMVAAMAETALAHVLDWHRHLYLYRRWQRERIWKRRRQFLASDRTVAILGLGALGRVAAARLASLGFQVAGYSRTPKEIPGVRCATDLAHALEGADAVVCLLPLTPETRGILDARLFAKIRPGGCVINLARGAHLVVPDLFAALDSGHLAHAWLDVFETEPLPPESPLGTHPAVTVTPHVAALVEPRTAVPKIAEAVNRVRRGELPPYLVDFDRGY
jgi:glyoxylate/hydroxypyruvate reductase A